MTPFFYVIVLLPMSLGPLIHTLRTQSSCVILTNPLPPQGVHLFSLVQCTSENGEKEDGGGGKNPVEVELGKDIEMTPLDDMDKK